VVGKDRIRHHAAHLHGREGVEGEHHDIARPADPVGHIDRRFCRHRIAVRGDVGRQQRIGPGIHPDDRDVRPHLRQRSSPAATCAGIDVDHDGIDPCVTESSIREITAATSPAVSITLTSSPIRPPA
jgi:hypothetical protein